MHRIDGAAWTCMALENPSDHGVHVHDHPHTTIYAFALLLFFHFLSATGHDMIGVVSNRGQVFSLYHASARLCLPSPVAQGKTEADTKDKKAMRV
jgi:hypothetical protein